LRIGIDLAPLRRPLTGVGNYELYLLAALLQRADAPQFHGFDRRTWRKVDTHYIDEFQSMPESERRNGAWWVQPIQLIGRSEIARRAYSWMRRRSFERSGEANDLSLFHAFTYTPPGNLRAPVIPVVYDLSFVRFPETHPPARLQSLQALPKLLKSAPVVHTISQFSAREIADIFGIPLSRIAVIYPGVIPGYGKVPENPRETLAHYKLEPKRFFLVVSTLEPRKNLRSLIIAYSRLSRADRDRLPLCIVGAPGWGALDLPKEAQTLEREGSVRFLGFVPNRHLLALYTHTRTMFYPSIYEGFGMPIIEALACGARVICSDASSMPEAGGNVVQWVAPSDIDSWFQEIQHAAENADCDIQETNRRQLHARQFTWERAAAQTIELYQRAAA
jgi:glycosyltransferase involved in cell wall biosynthesis